MKKLTVYVVEQWRFEEPQPPLVVTRTAEGALRWLQAAGFHIQTRRAGTPTFERGDGDSFAMITPFKLEG